MLTARHWTLSVMVRVLAHPHQCRTKDADPLAVGVVDDELGVHLREAVLDGLEDLARDSDTRLAPCKDVADRAAFFLETCGADAPCGVRSSKLLVNDDAVANILEHPLAAGTLLGPYRIDSSLGAGGMGEVYKACDSRLDRIVAIKVLPARLASDPQFLERFDREARSISALNHPNICTLYDVGEASIVASHASTHFLVMEYLEGETLAERLGRGPLTVAEALRIASGIISALAEAHRHGIIHRDLKPGNVFLVRGSSSSAVPTAKLLDFGLAKLGSATSVSGGLITATGTAPLTARGTILGTLQYMAPEQLEGGEADARTDIFAFGALVYEIVTSRKAFDGRSQASLLGAILKDDPPPISQLQPLAPPALDFLVRVCLAKDPDARFQTAHDVLLYLTWIAEGGSAAGVGGASRHASQAPRARHVGGRCDRTGRFDRRGCLVGRAFAGGAPRRLAVRVCAPRRPDLRSHRPPRRGDFSRRHITSKSPETMTCRWRGTASSSSRTSAARLGHLWWLSRVGSTKSERRWVQSSAMLHEKLLVRRRSPVLLHPVHHFLDHLDCAGSCAPPRKRRGVCVRLGCRGV